VLLSPASRPSRTTSAARVGYPTTAPLKHIIDRGTGKPVSHAFAKELVAGFAAAEVDKLAETKGEDWFDKEKAKRQAKEHAESMYDEQYVEGHGAEQYDVSQRQSWR